MDLAVGSDAVSKQGGSEALRETAEGKEGTMVEPLIREAEASDRRDGAPTEDAVEEMKMDEDAPDTEPESEAVSYTHLTLPTKRIV